jgi:uncharacterized flavoprotein (TIGR03862 family)
MMDRVVSQRGVTQVGATIDGELHRRQPRNGHVPLTIAADLASIAVLSPAPSCRPFVLLASVVALPHETAMTLRAGTSVKTIAIIGGGPAGLAAADILSETGHDVTVYDAMPTIGRKFLLAGKSGLNLTHAEDHDTFVGRFGAATPRLRRALDAFPPAAVREWADGLGSETFVGTSGRVFPKVMKASPLLRAWRRRLEESGVSIITRWRWTGLADAGGFLFETPEGLRHVTSDATLLALGGASWPRLGSDARWVGPLGAAGVRIHPFRPANCGFDVAWSADFVARFAGAAVKSVVATSGAGSFQGEFVISRHGIEGSLVYAHSASLRDALDAGEPAVLHLDLVPGRSLERLAQALDAQPRKASFSNRLRKAARIDGVKLGLVRECLADAEKLPAAALASAVKRLPLAVIATRPIEEAISSAGGVALDDVDERWMLRQWPGLFAAGEMLDWEAPTGGYLLTASMATGRAAAEGMIEWLDIKPRAER